MPGLSVTMRGLVKRYGDQAVVRGLDLDIPAGECFGLLGPNGAGKTTTLKMLLGLVQPTAGSITINGWQVPAEARQARTRIGIMPQMDNLDPDFTVAENLLVYGRYFGIERAILQQRIPALLELAGLTGKTDSRIGELSGGMKRRLTLARALVNDPDLIVLDEPTTGLDPQARHVIWQSLRRLNQQGKTVLLTTHFMDEAERLCDRLVIMDHGQSIAEGRPRDLISQLIEPQVVEVYGDQLAAWLAQLPGGVCERHELADETLYCYGHDHGALLALLQQTPALRHVQRPSSLEDVFLKLTGRELRD